MTDIDGLGFEAEPDAFAGLLGAYLDGELPEARREAVARHLRTCQSCRRALRAQTAIRDRLAVEMAPRATSALRDRVRTGLVPPTTTGTPTVVPLVRSRVQPIVAWAGWGVAAALALVLLSRTRAAPAAAGMSMSMGTGVPLVLDSVPVSVIDSALANFQRVAASDLPGAEALSKVVGRVPFGIPALAAPHMRLIGAWTTGLEGELVAVLAYRCHDRLVVQYVVSEQQFFRVARIRDAIARAGLYAAGRDGLHAVAWPGPDSGSLLIGAFSAADLAAMRS
ncbi:MAG: anti-sigma factor [Gemmatimonadales bacterium]